ncbi:hypothetical protein BGX27_003154 [Mortierella sp. AM989]|nr:hypothetical protein BGX27_003154 [Mortierella sp. AM989]
MLAMPNHSSTFAHDAIFDIVPWTVTRTRSSVMDELQSNPSVMPQDRKKMLGILDRFEKQAIDQEKLLDMSEDDILEQIQHQQHQQKSYGSGAASKDDDKVESASRKLTSKERDDLIRKTIEEERKEALGDEQHPGKAEGGDMDIDPRDREEMESILEQERQDLLNRFQGVNLEEESFESIWARLSPEERREFQEKFMISKLPDGGFNEESMEDEEVRDGAKVYDDEELEAKKLLQEMGETLQRGGEKVGDSISNNPMMAELDVEDLRAIRDAEISELIPIWRPWWEIEAEQAGQLKKVTISQVVDKGESERLHAGSINNIPQQSGAFSAKSSAVAERFILDEEAMLRPQHALVQDLDEAEREENERRLASMSVPRMVRPPHPSLIYHVCALLFAYVATSRILNGDLKEEPEQTLAYIFDICPFFSPSPTAPSSSSTRPPSKSSSIPLSPPTAIIQELPEVDDFETTLAILHTSSLNSTLWKGDTLRLEMLSLLLRDLTLILARPSRCLRSIQQLKDIFNTCMKPSSKGNNSGPKLFSKSALHRLLKKLEFYESYLVSDEYLLKTDRLDRIRTEVVMAGIRVRQEMVGWSQELENVERVKGTATSGTADSGDGADEVGSKQGSIPARNALIEELS